MNKITSCIDGSLHYVLTRTTHPTRAEFLTPNTWNHVNYTLKTPGPYIITFEALLDTDFAHTAQNRPGNPPNSSCVTRLSAPVRSICLLQEQTCHILSPMTHYGRTASIRQRYALTWAVLSKKWSFREPNAPNKSRSSTPRLLFDTWLRTLATRASTAACLADPGALTGIINRRIRDREQHAIRDLASNNAGL